MVFQKNSSAYPDSYGSSFYLQKDMLNGVFENVVRLRFMKQPECLRPGDQFIFRDGKLKAIGTVYDAVPLSS